MDSGSGRRVFVVPVGISWIEKANARGLDERVRRDAAAAFTQPGKSYKRGSRLSDDTKERIVSYYLEWGSTSFYVSAELATIRPDLANPVIETSDDRIPIRSGDHVYLLSSATSKGEFCALVNAALIKLVPDVTVDVQVVDNLSPTGDSPFDETTIGQLTDVVSQAWYDAREANGTLSIHPVGGFKATLPLLVYLISHLPPQPVGVQAFIRHEQGEHNIQLPILAAGVESRLLDDLDAVANSGAVVTGIWDGYAYRRAGNHYELTSLGASLLRLARLS